MASIIKHIEIKWYIKGYDTYGFGSDKKLYNLKTSRELKQCLNCSSIGYWMGKKFLTLKSIKILIYKPKELYLPY